MALKDSDSVECGNCDTRVEPEEAIRTETYGDLDRTKWQTLCCPTCGARLETVFVPVFDR